MPATAIPLRTDAYGRLVYTDAHGRRHVGVDPVRCFPLTDPSRFVALLDPEGREVALIESLDDLDGPTRRLVEDELALREFVPVVYRIVSAPSDIPSEWEVETDRGRTRFTLNSDDDVRRLGPHRALIVDSRGLRYHVPDVRALDATSRRALEHHF